MRRHSISQTRVPWRRAPLVPPGMEPKSSFPRCLPQRDCPTMLHTAPVQLLRPGTALPFLLCLILLQCCGVSASHCTTANHCSTSNGLVAPNKNASNTQKICPCGTILSGPAVLKTQRTSRTVGRLWKECQHVQ